MPSFAITDFIDSCRRFSDGSLVAEDVTVLRSVSERQMPDRYRIPFPEPAVSPVTQDRKEKSRHLRALWHELVQHLRDLRYISEEAFVFYHRHKKNILTQPLLQEPVLIAVSLYLREEKEWPGLLEILPPGSTVDRLLLQTHLSAIVDRIGLHTCWDGEGVIPIKYAPGERSVFSRALSYRLRTVSCSQFDLGPLPDYYGGEKRDVLNSLFTEGFNVDLSAGEDNILLKFWALLVDIDALLSSYVNNTDRRKKNPPLRYQLEPPEGDTVQLLEKLTGRDLRTGGTANISNKSFHIKTVNRIKRGARRRNHRPDNGLDIRLLQIKLWQAGYYTGTIDEQWGNLSHLALKNFLMDEAGFIAEELDPAPTDPDKFARHLTKKQPKAARMVRSLLVKVSDDDEVYAADFIGIIRVFTDTIASREREMKQNATLNEEEDLLRELPVSAGISNEKFDQHILGETGIEALFPDNTRHTERRVSFFRRVGGFIVGGLGKIVDWLKQGIREIARALGKLLGPVFTFIKKMMRPIRSAIDRFFSGFKYLASFVFGKPLLTEVAPATPTESARIFGTRFQLDFDSVNFIPSNYRSGEPARHAAHINQMRRDMAYFIKGVVWIIKSIGKLSNPGGWVWLGWQIVTAIARPILA